MNPGDLPSHTLGERFYIVLVEPEHSINIGSVARAMLNFGFKKLILVRPQEFDRERCLITARWASKVIQEAEVIDEFSDALSPMKDVIAFGGRKNSNAMANAILPECISELKQTSTTPTALVFGPEDTGLRNEHLEYCRTVVRIPSSTEYPSFNLAQSVLLVLNELTRELRAQVAPIDVPERPTWNEFRQLDRILDEVLHVSGFYRKGSPETIPPLVKNLFRRAEPDEREMRVLLALFARVQKTMQKKLDEEN